MCSAQLIGLQAEPWVDTGFATGAMSALPRSPCGNARLLLLSAGERLASIWCCFIWHFKSKQKWGEEFRFSKEEWHEEEKQEGGRWRAPSSCATGGWSWCWGTAP